jgi:CBS domain containing-hemolysin-like protein
MAWFWLGATLFWTVFMSFFSMEEMACISYNRLRLELSLRTGSRWATWLHSLISHPSRLFGTTLIGVNIGLVLSSECIRQLFCELNLNPNLSPLVHIPYILIIGELVPMFAARLFPEHIAYLGTPLLHISCTLFSPFLYIIDAITSVFRKLFFSTTESHFPHLQREGLRDLIEERKIGVTEEHSSHIDTIIGRIFHLKEVPAYKLMEPLENITVVQSTIPIGVAQIPDCSCVLVRNSKSRIIGYVRVWDIVNVPKTTLLGSLCRPPTFVNKNSHATEILFQLSQADSDIALVVDEAGEVIGRITQDDLISEITKETHFEMFRTYVEKTVDASLRVDEFLHEHKIALASPPTVSFNQLLQTTLGRRPSVGDTITLGPLRILVTKASFRGAKSVNISTIE